MPSGFNLSLDWLNMNFCKSISKNTLFLFCFIYQSNIGIALSNKILLHFLSLFFIRVVHPVIFEDYDGSKSEHLLNQNFSDSIEKSCPMGVAGQSGFIWQLCSVCVNVLVAFDVRLAWWAVRSGQRVTVATCEQPARVGVSWWGCHWVYRSVGPLARHRHFFLYSRVAE